jgi:amino acid permease
MKHFNPPGTTTSFLTQPEFIPSIFPTFNQIKATMTGERPGESSDLQIIFSCWNTMAGSAMVSLPWAFQTAGILLGSCITLVSFLVSYYTCSLVIITTKNDKDYVFTLRKYFGKPGFYMGLIGPTVLIFGAITVYFVVIVQSIYPLLFTLLTKVFKMDLQYRDTSKGDPHYYDFEHFSPSYIALGMYVILVSVSMKKDLSIFIKLSSIGVLCVISLILFVIGFGFHSIGNTSYTIDTSPSSMGTGSKFNQHLLLVNSQFSNLAGCLCAGFFIHQCSIPIISNAANPENNLRNVFIGFLLVFFCYIIVGILGYYAFTGSDFYDLTAC